MPVSHPVSRPFPRRFDALSSNPPSPRQLGAIVLAEFPFVPHNRAMIHRLFVEKRAAFRQAESALAADLRSSLDLPALESVRIFLRYDVEGVPAGRWPQIIQQVLAEPPVDLAYEEVLPEMPEAQLLAIEYLPGQYDQRADFAAQCIELVTGSRPRVAATRVYAFFGAIAEEQLERIKRYLINAVDSREASLEKPASLLPEIPTPAPVPNLEGFISADEEQLVRWHDELGLAMSLPDLAFCQQHFRDEARREPTMTEIRVLDTYWSDHCRHTTFLTELTRVAFEDSPLTAPIRAAYERYRAMRAEIYGADSERPESLMDIATIGMKWLRRHGQLEDLEISDEINAASIIVPVEISGRTEDWLVMFKNETHNHPTEIEPFGGAATCLGGAIRDPLSGRSYVYQAMRVTGAGDPRVPFAETLPGKLPQRKICREAALGYSSYGNQIGLATGLVREIYHPGYVAKRMEIGAVIAAAPRAHVRREQPLPGDLIVLVGGRTGRDGIGGATGSSKAHDRRALENSAEVQKGDPVCERKLQRLFRRGEVARLIKKSNDFGAGGVSVAIGELADSLDIDLDAVPRKYEGLDGTELAISESQERMAVVIDPEDLESFSQAAVAENLEASVVARVTDNGRLRLFWQGQTVVDLPRPFLDTNGVRQHQEVFVQAPEADASPLARREGDKPVTATWLSLLSDLNHASQRGLVEMFDSTIGGGSILHPFGGRTRSTPSEVMAALIPAEVGDASTATVMSFGFDPDVSSWSPYHGAVVAVLHSVARLVAAGADRSRIRLTLQEYFERLRDEPQRWGKPLAALLGALQAQEALGTAAVGGKDSMSGSFGDLDVPPTLVSFAVAPIAAKRVCSPEFKSAGNRILHVSVSRDERGVPDLAAAGEVLDSIGPLFDAGIILAARAVGSGGIAQAVAEMSFGNELGAAIDAGALPASRFFAPLYGDLVLEVNDGFPASASPFKVIGKTTTEAVLRHGEESLSIAAARSAWEAPLESVYPTKVDDDGQQPLEVRFEPREIRQARTRVARPLVVVPAFPGSNCEVDSARAFARAGAEVDTVLFRNLRPESVAESIERLGKAIESAQILFVPGGFSAGDEPAGSGKFIAAAFRHPRIEEAIMRLLKDRDGLILGICNGFQALVKLGLLPHGEIRPLTEEDPTLTHNLIRRHVSSYARTKVVSKASPWLAHCELGEEYLIPMSHGEGRFVANDAVFQQLLNDDQIATQYVDDHGKPTLDPVYNPNGSMHAVEGITSPCGRVFGKMGHSERVGPHVGKNLPGNQVQPIFTAGVAYYS